MCYDCFMNLEAQEQMDLSGESLPIQVLILQNPNKQQDVILKLLEAVDFAKIELKSVYSLNEVEQHLSRAPADIVLIDLESIEQNIRVTLEKFIKNYPLISLMVIGDKNLVSLEHELLRIGIDDYLNLSIINEKGLARSIRKAVEKKQILRELLAQKNVINSLVDAIKNGDFNSENGKDSPFQLTDLIKTTLLQQNADLFEKVQDQDHQIQQISHKDRLTGLANRMMFEQVLRRDLAHAKRQAQQLAVLYIDLDQFSKINRNYGHLIADELLRQVAFRLSETVRNEDFIARFSGDEFAVIVNDLKSTHHAVSISRKIIDALNEPYIIDEGKIFLSVCIGIALFPSDGVTAESLLKNADIALSSAKKLGTNMFQFSTDDLRFKHIQRLHLESDLYKALVTNQFFLEYQPIICLKNNKIMAAEALVRWQHPQFGLVMPDQFIELAEHSGQIHDLGRWIIKDAIMQAAKIRDAGFKDVKFSINLSAKQFEDNHLVDYICEKLQSANLVMHDFEFEIKEGTLMSNSENAVKIMQHISRLGGVNTIDNFGTGQNSIASLKTLPLATLKIDRKFIHKIGFDKGSENLIGIFINLAHQLGLMAQAEAIETEAQLEFLKLAGCDRAQGFYISRPLSADRLQEFLKKHPH